MKMICATALLFCLGAIALAQDETDLLAKYQKDLQANRNSSITHFRIGEIYFHQDNLQSAANEFREALNGDLEPRWTEVWSHLNLGRIFDASGQRDRAIDEYRRAQRTNDDTRGALEEGAMYLQSPYQRK
jgi:tetratricopeptide (TPR) repeat protein